MRPNRNSLIEQLECRTLLSVAAPLAVGAVASASNTAVIQSSTVGTGVTLNLVAGVPFTGMVAFHPSPVIDPPGALSASIDWGDGIIGPGKIQCGMHGGVGGYQIIGTHNYPKAATCKIVITLEIGPLPGSGMEFATQILGTINSKAIVAPRPANSAGGVTITETAGKNFTAALGTFNAIAPATGLHAIISWGDGTSSVGALKAIGIVGVDVIKFSVSGTHTYATKGTYPVHILVTKPGPQANPIGTIVATIDSTAIVQQKISLAGTIKGTYTTPLALPDVGKTYAFSGSGTAGALGAVSVSGKVKLPGFVASGHATGTLTLSNSQGSVTLALTGPLEPGFGAFPATLSYTVTSATGAYFDNIASGIIAVTLSKTGAKTFKFVIS